MTPASSSPDTRRLDAFLEADPVLARIRSASGPELVYLVGGAIRDALLGFPVDDLDLVVDGDPSGLIEQLDPGARTHERFGTAKLVVDGRPVDIARSRTEHYVRPGSLPTVQFGGIEDDLARRDFTINALAVGLDRPPPATLIDTFGGMEDLRAGLLRVLHADSFRDDPTRAIRGARYAARFGFQLAPESSALLSTVDFSTISSDRLRSELRLAAAEAEPLQVFGLLGDWDLVQVESAGLELAKAAIELLEQPLWQDFADRGAAVFRACFDHPGPTLKTLVPAPASPWEAVQLAGRFPPVDLLLARAAGGTWLDEWRRNWSRVTLEIGGGDLLAAGVPEGPEVGIGLAAAFRAKLEGGASGAKVELAIALGAVGDRS